MDSDRAGCVAVRFADADTAGRPQADTAVSLRSGAIDGAGGWRRFRTITLPMLSPVIFFNLVMQLINGFMVFTQAYIITGGRPLDTTLFYTLYLYQKGFRDFEMGYASAMAWFLLVIIAFFTLLAFRSSSFWVYYESRERE